jgi:uncharacterized protein YjdB
MANETTVNGDMIIHNDLAQTAYLERMQDRLEVFNQNSAGAIGLTSEAVVGDLVQRAFYKIGGSIEHRNVDATTTVETKKIGSDEMVGVKTPWKYGPYATTEEAFKRRGRTPTEFSALIGIDMGDAVMEGWVGYALKSLEAAIRSNATMVTSGDLALEGKKVLTKGLRKMGDKFSQVAIWVMDSSAYFDIVDQAIDNKVYEEAGVVVYGGTPGTLGKPVLVTDKCPANTIFGLQSGAVTVKESQAPGVRSWPINDQENLAIGFRSEGTVNVEILGYSWKNKLTVNPTLAQLGTSSNWIKYATSDKATAGFIIDLVETPTP